MVESLQHKLDRVRTPRVQITYDVEIGNAIIMKELPFVMGVLADLAGMPSEVLPKVKDRKFIEVDRDNFNLVMMSMRPRLTYRVIDKLAAKPSDPEADPKETSIELFFETMDDFQPVPVLRQIPNLNKLYQSRTLLKDLLTKLDGNDLLGEMLLDLITDAKKRKAVKAELGAIATPEIAG